MDKNICDELKILDNLIFRSFGKILKECDICVTPIQGKIIFYMMKNNNQDIYQKDIEQFLVSRRSTVSEILKKMEDNDLITRSLASDKRKRVVKLTQYSINKQKEIENKVVLFDKQLKKNITTQELELFFDVLVKIKNNIFKEMV